MKEKKTGTQQPHSTKQLLATLFADLNQRVLDINVERINEGTIPIPKSQVRLLGQISLMSHERVSAYLSLVQTNDLDALLQMEYVVKVEFKKLLNELGLIYDEDSYLIWIPPGARFDPLFNLETVEVHIIDAESALVSKAVKAPEKNKQLIREAIASGQFSKLLDRILASGGKLEDFL